MSFLPSLFFLVQRAFGSSKKRSFDEKSVGGKFLNKGTEPFLGQKGQKRGKKAEKLRLFRLTHAFLGKKHGKGDQGVLKGIFGGSPKITLQNGNNPKG